MGNASVNLSVETNDGQAVRTGRIVFELDDMSSRTEIPFSQQGNDAGGTETVYAITPISDFFLCDPQSADGGEYRVYTCTFDADTETVTFSQTGNTVWRIGGTDDKTSRVFGKSQIYNGRFATLYFLFALIESLHQQDYIPIPEVVSSLFYVESIQH